MMPISGRNIAITMLPTDKIVREVVLSEDGLAAALAAGTIIIDMSTSDPRATVEIGKAAVARGLRYVDAPVMGGVVFAKDGSLDIMVGGNDADVASRFSRRSAGRCSAVARSAQATRSRRLRIM